MSCPIGCGGAGIRAKILLVTARPLDGRWLASTALAAVVCAAAFALSLTVTNGEGREALAGLGWLAAIAVPVLAVRAGVDAGVHKERAAIR